MSHELEMNKELNIMSHKLEMNTDETAKSMVYVGDVPWHGLGKRIPADLSPEQVLKVAELDWTVKLKEAFVRIGDKRIPVGKSALYRESDLKVLDVVGNDWNPVQNHEAFEFFNEFIAAGDMEMHTAGSLKDGKHVWALAKVNESFELFGGKDRVDSYLLFSNPHLYGKSIDIRFTPIRVVCNNTITLALSSIDNKKSVAKSTHRVKFDAEKAKQTLGLASKKLEEYKERAEYLSKSRYDKEDVVEFFKRVFPLTSNAKNKELSRNAERALEIIHTQPGAEFGEGTYWSAVNAVTFLVDHELGRSQDNRMTSAWFGAGKDLKLSAMKLALEMA